MAQAIDKTLKSSECNNNDSLMSESLIKRELKPFLLFPLFMLYIFS